jgi:4-amino-4-deoxy-L-arabinose transferase-like glycosyltransferase
MFLPPQPDRQRIALRQQSSFYVVIAGYLVALSLVGGALLTRYLLPVIPLVILLCVSTLWRRVRGWQIAALAVCGMFVASWFVAPPYRFAPEDNLAYRDYILLHVEAERFVEKHYPGARVLTAWPASDELTKTYLGYIAKPMPVVRVENFSLEQVQLAQQSTSPYDVALLFSTKYETPRRLHWDWWEKEQQRFFDFHQDLPPELAARMLGGQIVFAERRAGEWVAVVDMRRAQNASLR